MNAMREKRLTEALGTALLILIIACHELTHVKLVLWLLLGFVCLYHFRSAVNTVFFFSAFFAGSGFFQNPLVTVKHFHIGLALLILAGILRWKWVLRTAKENWRSRLVFIFWIIVIAISATSLWRVGEGWEQGLRTTGNLFLTLMCASFLSILLSPEDAIHGLAFLVLGTCVRGASGLLSYCGIPGFYLNEILIFNNHIAFYLTTALFCLLPFIAVTKERWVKICYILTFYFLFFLLVLTCSRTSYLSFVIGLMCFVLVGRRFNVKGLSELKFVLFLLLLVCLGGTLVLWIKVYYFPVEVPLAQPSLGYLIHVVGVRLKSILNLFLPYYWERVLVDKENFGFLGYHRMDQFQVVGEILKDHWILGIGLLRRVTDFHSLYLTLLGATGIIGLGSFLAFCYYWMRQLLRSIVPLDAKTNIFRVALLSCMVNWLATSLMETYFLQFNIWTMMTAGIALGKSHKRKSADK